MIKERYKRGNKEKRWIAYDRHWLSDFFFVNRNYAKSLKFLEHICWYGRFDKEGRLILKGKQFRATLARSFGIKPRSFSNELSILVKYNMLHKIRNGVYEINEDIILFLDNKPRK